MPGKAHRALHFLLPMSTVRAKPCENHDRNAEGERHESQYERQHWSRQKGGEKRVTKEGQGNP